MEQRLTDAINRSDYLELHSIFNGNHGDNKRMLSACFVRSVLSSSKFLLKALSSSNSMILEVIKGCLANLPASENVLSGADNTLRLQVFDALVEQSAYHDAASLLSTFRIESSENSPYYLSPEQSSDIFLKIAECFLHEEEYVEADVFVTRVGPCIEAIQNPEEHIALILRYKSTHARVLDANRKFLEAAVRYFDLSQIGSQTDMVDADDLLEFLGRAATCAILSPSGAQRNRILELVYKDERLEQLSAVPHFSSHSTILTKMYKVHFIHPDKIFTRFEESLAQHQKAVMGDGMTTVRKALIEHNLVAISKVFKNIYLDNLSKMLDLHREKVEKMATRMISDGSIKGSIDEVDGVLTFGFVESPHLAWNGAITSFSMSLNEIVGAVRHE